MKELWWMASEKKRVLGELMAVEVKWVQKAVWGDLPRTLDELNPYAIIPEKSEAMKELEKWQAKRAWRVMCGEGEK